MNTGGGAFIDGNVHVEHGDFVARDRISYNEVRSSQEGLHGDDLSTLFERVYGQIQAHAAQDPAADADVLNGTARKIEQELKKGEQANPEQVQKWLSTLSKLAPEVLEVVVNVLTNPGAAVASGVKLVASAFRVNSAREDTGRAK